MKVEKINIFIGMDKENIVEVKVVENGGDDLYLTSPENHSCLTCGSRFKEGNKIIVNTVENIEGMKEWLRNRCHQVMSEDKFLICDKCREEFHYEMTDSSINK